MLTELEAQDGSSSVEGETDALLLAADDESMAVEFEECDLAEAQASDETDEEPAISLQEAKRCLLGPQIGSLTLELEQLSAQ